MTKGLDLVLLWHMHQPDYRVERHGGENEFAMPWTYLHAIKDYADMAAHLERHEGMRAVVNFAPVLLEQIEDYAAQFRERRFRDPLLRCLAQARLDDLSLTERRMLLDTCFRSNHRTMLDPYPPYANLYRIHREITAADASTAVYLSGDYFSDLLTWYHLAWCGETERRRQPLLMRLMAKGCGFDAGDRRALLELIGELIAGLIGRYRVLAEKGCIELSASPLAHPIAPLLLDPSCARQAQPDLPLPANPVYPGGRSRVLAHIDEALLSHERCFGHRPEGLWPAEGAVSDPFVRLLAGGRFAWVASSESVLANSLRHQGVDFDAERGRHLYRPWQLADCPGLTLFFRDERLSDLIGFDYAKWYGSDAVSHFVGELEAIADAAPDGERPVVSVILDGENAWEYYPYNAYYFLDHLYEALATHPTISVTTFAERSSRTEGCGTLETLVAGSWVQGTLSTWIGHADKNRAWELLCEAKRSYDLALSGGTLGSAAASAAARRLACCESSDWFWWLGSANEKAAIAAFDGLFRENLKGLYGWLGFPPPTVLDRPVSQLEERPIQEAARDGTMLRGQPASAAGGASHDSD